jgi:cytochrome b6-f complex iron-sulfur subunit
MPISRRQLLRGTLLGGIAAGVAGVVAGIANYLYPRISPEKDYVRISARRIPEPGGEPILNRHLGFYVVNLSPEDNERNLKKPGEGLLALSTVCPHQGRAECPVRWSPDRTWNSPFGGTEVGVFECPCHGSIYTKAGVRMFGPTPRSLDTLRIEAAGDDGIKVHFEDVLEGGIDSGAQAYGWP